jgi:hypothetical protein
VFNSCTKEEVFNTSKQSYKTEESSQQSNQKLNSDDKFAENLLTIVSNLPSGFHIEVTKNNKGNSENFVFNVRKDTTNPSDDFDFRVYCRGELGVSFAKCVKKAIDDFDLRCIRIHEAGGEWLAEDC